LASAPRQEGMAALLLRLKEAATEAISRALDEGSLATAEEVLGNLRAATGESMETRRFGEGLDLCREAARHMDAGDHDKARIDLARIRKLLPGPAWPAAGEEALRQVAEGLAQLRSGPLASFLGSRGAPALGPTRMESRPAGSAARPAGSPARDGA